MSAWLLLIRTHSLIPRQICTSGRPFGLIDVHVVAEDGSLVTPASDGSVVGNVRGAFLSPASQAPCISPSSSRLSSLITQPHSTRHNLSQVWIRGLTVFSGYRNSPKGPSDGFDALGFFDTGDMATVDRHGYITVVDRAKDMVLSGGENVYSTEVENALASHPAVAHSAVFGLPHPVLGETVTAAVVLRKGGAEAATARELTAHCAARLAGYKVPYRVLFFEDFPMTASGKARGLAGGGKVDLPAVSTLRRAELRVARSA